MGRFVTADLEECMKELASRARRNFESMTSFQKDDYRLCRSIEHLIWVEACNAPTSVADITSCRQESSPDPTELAREAATGEVLFADAKVLIFRKSA